MSKQNSPDKPDKNDVSTTDNPEQGSSDTIETVAVKIGLPSRILSHVRTRYKELIRKDHTEEEAANIVLREVDSDALTTTEEILENEKLRRREAQKLDLINALQAKKLKSHALYRDPDPWRKVSDDWRYRNRQGDLPTISNKINDILKVVGHDGSRKLRMVPLGPGTGQKDKSIIKKILKLMKWNRASLGEEKLESMDVDFVDVSPEMLFGTFTLIFDHLRPKIKNLNLDTAGENHPWKAFKEFIDTATTSDGLPPEYTDNPSLATLSVQKAFYKYLNGNLVSHDERAYVRSLFKFALARYFGLKKADHYLLYKLDRDIDLPFEIYPHKTTFEELDGTNFRTTRTVSTCYSHLGNEAMNQFPEITIEKLYANNLLKETPEIIRDTKATGEAKIRATYVMFSFQTNADGSEAIMDGYDIPSFNHFVSHLFKDPELATFIDPNTANVLKNEKCFKIEATYEEDPDNEGYYGTVHRLVFTRDVNIKIQPEGQSPQIFDFNKGEEIMLLPSYKPSVEQIKELCEKHGLKVVREYLNQEGTNAVFVIRRKTKEERGAIGRESSSTREAVDVVMEGGEQETQKASDESPMANKKIYRQRRGGHRKRKSGIRAAKHRPTKTNSKTRSKKIFKSGIAELI